MINYATPATGATSSGPRMGLFIFTTPETQTVAFGAFASSRWNPGLRVRPSHHSFPPDEWKLVTWGRFWKKWGDDKIVPIPFKRGVPFRGDIFGPEYYISSIKGL